VTDLAEYWTEMKSCVSDLGRVLPTTVVEARTLNMQFASGGTRPKTDE
jgi:hypothetical protein